MKHSLYAIPLEVTIFFCLNFINIGHVLFPVIKYIRRFMFATIIL